MEQAKKAKAIAKDKGSKDKWEHIETQALVRQKVEQVQGFDDAIASKIEQEAMGEKVRKGAAGSYFKRLDVNKECAMRMLAATDTSCNAALPWAALPHLACLVNRAPLR